MKNLLKKLLWTKGPVSTAAFILRQLLDFFSVVFILIIDFTLFHVLSIFCLCSWKSLVVICLIISKKSIYASFYSHCFCWKSPVFKNVLLILSLFLRDIMILWVVMQGLEMWKQFNGFLCFILVGYENFVPIPKGLAVLD